MQGLRFCLRKRFRFALYDSKRPTGRSLSLASIVLWQVCIVRLKFDLAIWIKHAPVWCRS